MRRRCFVAGSIVIGKNSSFNQRMDAVGAVKAAGAKYTAAGRQ